MIANEIAVARDLAEALDSNDFDTVHTLLSPDCIYTILDETHEGPDAIVASYRNGSDLARSLFDEVEYTNHVSPLAQSGTVRIRFIDDLAREGATIVHVTDQDVTIGPDGLVHRIEDRPVEGERERLDAFLAEHGISRPD